MKRIFELASSEMHSINSPQLKEIIRNSEGRTVMAETIVSYTPYIKGISNIELAASFGADMITLNLFDFNNPFIFGIDDIKLDLCKGIPNYFKEIPSLIKKNLENENYILNIKKLVGRFIGVNLEPVPKGTGYNLGLQLNEANLKKVKKYRFDYIVITGNPNTGVNEETIQEGIRLAKSILGDDVLILAGKMHGAGSNNIYEAKVLEGFISAGADGILLPAPGTVPGFDVNSTKMMIEAIHQAHGLTMTTIGTSQEGSSKQTIGNIALMSKMAGADIQHIGDCGTFGVALPENIMSLSIAIRGIRHTYRKMAQSINR